MNVTAIEPAGNLYGSEHCLLDVIDGTSRSGVTWDVVLPPGGFHDLLATRGIRSTPILLPESHTIRRSKKAWSYWLARRHVRSHPPDVLYLNQAGMLRGLNAIVKGLRIPVVCQIQTLEDARFVAAHPSSQSRVVTFICNSRFIAEASEVEAHKLSVLYQPVMERSETPPLPERGGRWRIGILGRIAISKGHWVFLEAATRLVERRSDVEFAVIGEGIAAETTELFRDAVASAGMSNAIDLRGFRTDVPDELARLHVVTIPSLAEPLGRVLLDACVAQRPVVLSDSGGLGEFSRHFDLGRRVKPADSAALASAWSDLLDHYDDEVGRFTEAATKTLGRLSPHSYISAVMGILENAAQHRSTAIEWRGDPA